MKESFDALVDYLMKSGLFLEQAVEILEKSMIERALQSTGANQSEASKMLGIHRNTLQRKMVAYEIDGAHHGAHLSHPDHFAELVRCTAPAPAATT